MKQYFYRSYNKLAKYYYKPIIIDATPEEYQEAYRRSILTETDDRKLAAIQDFQVHCVAEFDDNDGLIKVYDKPIYLFDVDDLLRERVPNGKEKRKTKSNPKC